MTDQPRNENMIAALKRERASYVARKLDDRVTQVDEQLRHYGYDPERDGDHEQVVDPSGGPVGRASKAEQQQTASGQGPAQGPEEPVQPEPVKPAASRQSKASGSK